MRSLMGVLVEPYVLLLRDVKIRWSVGHFTGGSQVIAINQMDCYNYFPPWRSVVVESSEEPQKDYSNLVLWWITAEKSTTVHTFHC